MAKILIVEDERGINELIKRSLELTGHHGFQAYSGLEAVDAAGKMDFDLVLLDISLPDLDGFHVFRFLEGLPVIFVTARDEIPDRVKGLNAGAEDYIVKPFDVDELLARVNAVLRRRKKDQQIYRLGDVKVDLHKCAVTRKNRPVELTNQEYELLKALLVNRNIALSRNRLLELAWGNDYEGDERTVDVHIQRLRKKLALEEYIKTVFKLGYRLEL